MNTTPALSVAVAVFSCRGRAPLSLACCPRPSRHIRRCVVGQSAPPPRQDAPLTGFVTRGRTVCCCPADGPDIGPIGSAVGTHDRFAPSAVFVGHLAGRVTCTVYLCLHVLMSVICVQNNHETCDTEPPKMPSDFNCDMRTASVSSFVESCKFWIDNLHSHGMKIYADIACSDSNNM